MSTLELHIPGFEYPDLFEPIKLAELATRFFGEVRAADPALMEEFDRYRQGAPLANEEVSRLLIAMARHLSDFLEKLFGVEAECRKLKFEAQRDATIFRIKKDFFVRRALKKISPGDAKKLDRKYLAEAAAEIRSLFPGIPEGDPELEMATVIGILLDHERYVKVALPDKTRTFAAGLLEAAGNKPRIASVIPASRDEQGMKLFLSSLMNILERWLVSLYANPAPGTTHWGIFKVPKPVDYQHLVETENVEGPVPGMQVGPEGCYRRREGFDLTDHRFSGREIMSEVDYCIFCHEREQGLLFQGVDGKRTSSKRTRSDFT